MAVNQTNSPALHAGSLLQHLSNKRTFRESVRTFDIQVTKILREDKAIAEKQFLYACSVKKKWKKSSH